ncbi:MAG: plasmid pRiA4b ORF-3 family protein [Oscillospiraceae bacterium]|nr:plasmid pRiA4b ORF-3 family protein [Oscillospiraceae bacterium]
MKAYQLKITIKDSHPPIWRRVMVPAGISFNQLALILNETMGWSGGHMNCFEFASLGVEFMDLEETFEDDFSVFQDASAEIIDTYVEQVKSFTYTYDFGDDWRHQVAVEQILTDYPLNYPQVVKYKGDVLYEDCGGIYGMYELLDILKNKKHPQYGPMAAFAEDAVRYFDMEAVNEDLSSLCCVGDVRPPMSMEEIYEAYWAGEPLYTIQETGTGRMSGGQKSGEVIPFPGVSPASMAQQEDGLSEDMEDAIAFGENITLIQVIEMLKAKTDMTEQKILDILEIDDDHYAMLQQLKSIMDSHKT